VTALGRLDQLIDDLFWTKAFTGQTHNQRGARRRL
jgi:hypothetical protein